MKKLRSLILAKAASLRSADHRSRDRIRRELKILHVALQIKKERRAA